MPSHHAAVVVNWKVRRLGIHLNIPPAIEILLSARALDARATTASNANSAKTNLNAAFFALFLSVSSSLLAASVR